MALYMDKRSLSLSLLSGMQKCACLVISKGLRGTNNFLCIRTHSPLPFLMFFVSYISAAKLRFSSLEQ